jgi:hypothetical protein
MIDKLKELMSNMNSKGIPIPLARDPKSGSGSLTFTMAVVSFGICIVLLGGKVTKLVGNVDYDNALWLLGLTLSTYLGRQFQKNGKQMSMGTVSDPQTPTVGGDNAGTSK